MVMAGAIVNYILFFVLVREARTTATKGEANTMIFPNCLSVGNVISPLCE